MSALIKKIRMWFRPWIVSWCYSSAEKEYITITYAKELNGTLYILDEKCVSTKIFFGDIND